MTQKEQKNDSRIDNTDRYAARETERRWILFQGKQRQADRAEVSEEMEGYAGTESSEGEVYRKICEEGIGQKRPKMRLTGKNLWI